jgi:hypothetical protein
MSHHLISSRDPEAIVQDLAERLDYTTLARVALLLLARLRRGAPGRLSRLMGALADNVAELPDEELLADCRTAGRDPAKSAAKVRATLKAAVRSAGRCRRCGRPNDRYAGTSQKLCSSCKSEGKRLLAGAKGQGE